MTRETLDTISSACFFICLFGGAFFLDYGSNEPAVELWLILGAMFVSFTADAFARRNDP